MRTMDLKKFYKQLVADLLIKHGELGQVFDGSHNVSLGAYHFGIYLNNDKKLYFLFVNDYLSVYAESLNTRLLKSFNDKLTDPDSLKHLDEFIVKVLADD